MEFTEFAKYFNTMVAFYIGGSIIMYLVFQTMDYLKAKCKKK